MADDFKCRSLDVVQQAGHWRIRFQAMASPCDCLLDINADQAEVTQLGQIVADEAWRIEQKYSRYRDDSVIARIHAAAGQGVELDAETVRLLDYAAQCYQLSDGLFDITSGILRHLWRFDGSGHVPKAKQIKQTLQRIGWNKLAWQAPLLQLPENMELDFGGFGKEYAVDRVASLLRAQGVQRFVVNFGGDLWIEAPPQDGTWQIGLEDPTQAEIQQLALLKMKRGGLATSGDAKRCIEFQGKRYGHIINPKTGWPMVDAPRSVTVLAGSCLQAGFFSTLAILHGDQAEAFLKAQQQPYWLVW